MREDIITVWSWGDGSLCGDRKAQEFYVKWFFFHWAHEELSCEDRHVVEEQKRLSSFHKVVLCGSFYLLLFEQMRGGRRESDPLRMKKLSPGWKVVTDLFQMNHHSRPVNKSFCKGHRSSSVWGCWLAFSGLASSCQHVPCPGICKDSQQPNKHVPAHVLEPLLGIMSLSFLSVSRVQCYNTFKRLIACNWKAQVFSSSGS